MRRILSAVVLAAALPFAAFAQAPAAGGSDTSTAAPATKSESKTESKSTTQADGSMKTEKKAKKTAPRHKAAKRSGEQASPAPAAK